MSLRLTFIGKALAGILGALNVSACAWLPPMEQDGESVAVFDLGVPTQGDEVGGLLRYAQHLRHLSDSALERELINTQESLENTRDPGTRVRAALLLSHPTAPFRQDEQASRILTELIQEDSGEHAVINSFAAYYLGILEQREDARNSLRKLRHQLAAEREQRRLLQTQLEALKAIETALEQREVPADIAAPSAASPSVK